MLYLNGPNKGKIVKCEMSYTEAEEQAKKDKMMFKADGVDYAGWCRCCSTPVRQTEARYISNTDGLNRLHVDVFHKRCCK